METFFGSFTEAGLEDYANDASAFIFSLINKEEKPFKAMSSDDYKGHYNFSTANGDFSRNGLSLGFNSHFGKTDIYIADKSNTNQDSHSDFGRSYQHQDYPTETERAQNILAGSRRFQTVEIEVLEMEF